MHPPKTEEQKEKMYLFLFCTERCKKEGKKTGKGGYATMGKVKEDRDSESGAIGYWVIQVADFRTNCSHPALTAPQVPGLMESLRNTYPNGQRLGGRGFCWGGKIVSVTCAGYAPLCGQRTK